MRADVGDVNRQFRTLEGQMNGVNTSTVRLDSGMKSAHLQTGRLANQFAGLAGQIANVHPVVGNLAGVLGNFAYGSLMTVGILGGLAALAVAYDLITSSARAAKKETDTFIKSLVDEAKAAYNASYAGRQLAADRAYEELQAAKRANPVGVRSVIGSIVTGGPMIDAADAEAVGKRLADAQTAVRVANERLGKSWDENTPKIGKTTAAVDALKFSYNQLRNEIEKTRRESEEAGLQFWRNIMNARGEADELTKEMSDIFLKGTLTPAGVDISDSVKSAGKDGKIITDNATKNTNDMRAAIWGAASQSASIIVSALNIGGGGRGSGLGGAIGSTAGFALGFAFGGGPVGGAIGATIGNIAGSFLGGLFDNKEATNDNTAATRALTQAMLLNAPSGFKAEPYRYGASIAASRGGSTTVNIYGVTDAKEVARVVSKYATRGGAPLFSGA